MATALRPDSVTASRRDSISPEEWALRVDLAAAYRLVAHYGWDDLIFTHLSARACRGRSITSSSTPTI